MCVLDGANTWSLIRPGTRGGGTWDTSLYTVRGVGSESRDVDVWTQTSLYTENRGLPSTDDPGI
jgi:hypothetical protein